MRKLPRQTEQNCSLVRIPRTIAARSPRLSGGRHRLLPCVFLILASGVIGCSRPNEPFAGDRDAARLDGKSRSVDVTFTHAVQSVTPETELGVTARIDGQKVAFTQIEEAPDEERTVRFTVKGNEDGQEASVAITLAAGPPGEDLEPAGGNMVLKMDSNGMGEIVFNFDRGKVDHASLSPQMDGFILESSPRQVKLMARNVLSSQFDRFMPLEPRHDFEIDVTARGGKKGAKFKVLGIREKKSEGITFSDLQGDKIEAAIPEKQMGPLQLEVKLRTGTAEKVQIGDRQTTWGLSASLANSKIVTVMIAPEAVPGSYEVWVDGKDRKGKVDSKARFTLVLRAPEVKPSGEVKPSEVKPAVNPRPPRPPAVTNAPIVLEDLKDGAIEAMIPRSGANPLMIKVKIVSGAAQSVSIKRMPSGLKAELSQDNSVVMITVSPEAQARAYEIWVSGPQPDNKTTFALVLK